MRQLVFVTFLFTVFQGRAQTIVQFKESYPLSVLNFLQAAADDPHSSVTYREYIRSQVPEGEAATFAAMAERYRNLQLEFNYVFNYYPEKRQRPHSTMELIKNAAVQTDDVNAFLQRVSGMVPNEQWLGLKALMPEAARFFDRMMGTGYNKAVQKQIRNLQQYAFQMDEIFSRVNRFYGSTWQKDQPFTVAVFGIPGARGNTTASPQANALALGVLTEASAGPEMMGVVAHEIGHVLYDEQRVAVQEELEQAFAENSSPYAVYAHNYFDEALATATGNGWAYEYLTGAKDTGSWYNDEYIDGFGRALYPMVKEYIKDGKTIDGAFAGEAIKLFEQRFPDAIYNYQNLLNAVSFYTDAKDHQQYERISNCLQKSFRVISMNSSYPILHQISQSRLSQSEETQLVVIHSGHAANFKALKKKFPELKKIKPAREQIISFRDERKRPVIIVVVEGEHRVEAAMERMVRMGKMDPVQMVQYLEN